MGTIFNLYYPIIVRAKSELKIDPEEGKKFAELNRNLKYLRGHILDLIINIEDKVETFVEKSLISKNSSLKNIFQENILHSKNLTLKNKIDLINRIIKEKKYLSTEDSDDLAKSLNFVISERNKWAHGNFSLEQIKKNKKLEFKSYLNYINNKGQKSVLDLSDKYFSGLNDKLVLIEKKLTSVMIKKGLLPKDYPKN
jgi:hypothetical protein